MMNAMVGDRGGFQAAMATEYGRKGHCGHGDRDERDGRVVCGDEWGAVAVRLLWGARRGLVVFAEGGVPKKRPIRFSVFWDDVDVPADHAI